MEVSFYFQQPMDRRLVVDNPVEEGKKCLWLDIDIIRLNYEYFQKVDEIYLAVVGFSIEMHFNRRKSWESKENK